MAAVPNESKDLGVRIFFLLGGYNHSYDGLFFQRFKIIKRIPYTITMFFLNRLQSSGYLWNFSERLPFTKFFDRLLRGLTIICLITVFCISLKNLHMKKNTLLSAILTLFICLASHAYGQSTCTAVINCYANSGHSRGYSGDGGAATAAQLDYPWSVASDASGNVYLADYNNYVIRKIDPSGIISTFAGTGTSGYSGDGGAATAAQFTTILGVTSDVSGNIYISDDHRIRKVNTSGIVTTIAGTGSAGSSGDGGAATAATIDNGDIKVDGSGNIYFIDNVKIRKIDGSGIVTTVAGNGINGYTGDGGPATAAEIYSPVAIVLDATGNLYIADYNGQVRKVNTSGVISTFAGGPPQGILVTVVRQRPQPSFILWRWLLTQQAIYTSRITAAIRSGK
jgi:hypothetical protein